MNVAKPRLLACLLGAIIAGPIGCASQQAAPIPGDGAADTTMPLTVNALLDPPLAVVDPTTPAAPGAGAAAEPPAAPQPASDAWPRQVELVGATALVYLPQVDSWHGNQLAFRVAVAIRKADAKDEIFGVVWGTARTGVDRLTQRVALEDLRLGRASFPTLPDHGLDYLRQLRTPLPAAMATMSLALLEGELAASGTVKAKSVQVNNDPPRVIISTTPAILVPIDGQPAIRPVADSRFERVLNTQALLVRERGQSAWYLHVFDGWLTATALEGPWSRAAGEPSGLNELAGQLAKKGLVDLLDGGPHANPKPSLQNGVPTIYASQVPAELIVFKGQPNFVPITGTGLLWAENTTADVLVNTANNDYYTLLSGRWYRASALTGAWTYTPANALPADFSRIPGNAPAGAVLPSVAGTPQAQEALIANSIPQTAAMPLAKGPKFTPVFDGAPQFRPIDGTPLRYVSNAEVPIIAVAPNNYYAVEAGVWFTASGLTGPWFVATSVPAVIYDIPVSSPLHYVTYVHVYGASKEVVYVGYTPGYLGNVVTTDGVVVYGTGYYYTPWIGSMWYAPPYTWGLAAAPIYNPYVGYAYGFGLGLATAAWATDYWGGAWYHPGYWGYPCCGSTSASVYGRWGNTVYAGSRSWYANADGKAGSRASGSYTNMRTGTSGSYAAGRSYNADTGQAQRGYDRTFNTAGGATGNVARGTSYNTESGQRSYASSASASGPGGSSISKTAGATAGPDGVGAQHTTTAYDARTGQTKSYTSSGLFGNHYAGADGSAYRSSDSGWQQHGADGWQAAGGDTAWADREQNARNNAESHASAGGFGGDNRFGGGGDRFGGGFGGRFGGGFGGRFGGRR
ncbi:carbohydrate-binding family V/XII [Candidatus Accumulibacter sp. ACC003]|uniref:carbohydrate-binding family V/XII n=1 Tax=Candidatus Accumulibacter sp. ACC003 TaxID=2823334 RepID=UPI0025C4AB7C|nr:carbohydrate-binding family V/XII [Candidatus Accumulibacter sp. ACC003]